MQYYKVRVRIRRLNDYDDAYEYTEYTPVYANTAEEAANSIIIQKKVKKEDIREVSFEQMY